MRLVLSRIIALTKWRYMDTPKASHIYSSLRELNNSGATETAPKRFMPRGHPKSKIVAQNDEFKCVVCIARVHACYTQCLSQETGVQKATLSNNLVQCLFHNVRMYLRAVGTVVRCVAVFSRCCLTDRNTRLRGWMKVKMIVSSLCPSLIPGGSWG